MPSTLGFALLGLLARQPRTGYELTQLLRAPIGYFWKASHSQVYPELAALERAKMISHRVIDGPGPRDTKRYQITALGRRALSEWSTRPPNPDITRDELMLKVFSLWTADPAGARAMVVAQREANAATLRHYQQLEREILREGGEQLADPTTPNFYSYATLRRGLSYEAHAVGWCDWLLEALERTSTPRSAALRDDGAHKHA